MGQEDRRANERYYPSERKKKEKGKTDKPTLKFRTYHRTSKDGQADLPSLALLRHCGGI